MKYSRKLSLVAGRALLTAMVVLMAACASKPKPAATAAKPATDTHVSAPATQSLEQYMQDAAKAATEGNDKERARETYRTAARLYPSSKEPWLKLSEDYFESSSYGQAILCAQEVVQRDPNDSVATSILAVSGLRVSVGALAVMHDQNSKLTGGTRGEAQTLARMLRESLGESELVPQPAPTATAAAPVPVKPAAPSRSKTVVVKRPSVAVAPSPPAAAVDASADDPFKILKK